MNYKWYLENRLGQLPRNLDFENATNGVGVGSYVFFNPHLPRVYGLVFDGNQSEWQLLLGHIELGHELIHSCV